MENVQDMTFNAHLSILSAIIIGLAAVKLLQGILWMIHGRQRIKVYWVHLVWVVFAITAGSFHYFQIGQMPGAVLAAGGFWGLPHILLTPLFIYLFSGLLFPPSGEEGPVDLRDFYYENRTWIFGTWVVILLISIAEGVIKLHFESANLWIYLGVFIFGALAVIRNERFHMAMAILVLLTTFAMYITKIASSITPQ